MRDDIRRLLAAGYNEDLICQALDIEHRVYRRLISMPPDTPLTTDAKVEIRYSTRHMYSIKELQQEYRTTKVDVLQALYGVHKRKPTDLRDIQAFMQETGACTFEEVKSAFKLPAMKAKAWLEQLGLEEAPASQIHHKVCTMHDEGYLLAQIAEACDLSVCAVSLIAKRYNRTRQRGNQRDDWDEILETLKTHTISRTSELHDVTRAAIYYQLRKKRND
jgi:hypothetical protein